MTRHPAPTLRAIRTQAEVAAMLGLTRQSVGRAERKAIKKIREGLAMVYNEMQAG